MKLKIMLAPDDEIRSELENIGIIDDPNSKYILTKSNLNLNFIQAKNNGSTFYISIKDILYFESSGHDVYVYTISDTYMTHTSLKQLEKLLDSDIFLRISSSVIVNINMIKRIEASVFQKFTLHMKNNNKIDVSKSYYYIFKEKMNI